MNQPERILIVDPDGDHLTKLESMLRKRGCIVAQAQTGGEAIAAAPNFKPQVCIVEPMLPDMDGFSLSLQLKATPDVRVLMISTTPVDERARTESREKFGVSGYVIKPYTDPSLWQAVTGKVKKRKEQELDDELAELLENTLSGLDIDALKKGKKPKPPKAKPAPPQMPTSPAPTEEALNRIHIDTEDLERAMAEIQQDPPKVEAQPVAIPEEVDEPLTSSDIFGELIDDIESGQTPQSPTIVENTQTPVITLRPRDPLPEQTEDLDFETDPEATIPMMETNLSQAMANEYQLLEKIASGGMAEVWKAKLVGEKGFEKIVAVKKILPHLSANEDFITMFTDEAKVAAKLTHPNIAQIYELRIGNPSFIAMEYVDGHTLRGIMRQCDQLDLTLPPEIAAYIGMKLCNALHYAHGKRDFDEQPLNIVHRDVSPQNVIISHHGEIKLVDFGIAKASIKATETMAGSLKGKLLYMSPEQGDGRALDCRTDIFSLGNVLYESLTGDKLFQGNSELAILNLVRDAQFTPIREANPDIPTALEQVLLKALAKEPEDRFESARHFEKALQEFLRKANCAHFNESDIAEYVSALFQNDISKLRGYGVVIPEEEPQPAEPEPPQPEAPPQAEPLAEQPSPFETIEPPLDAIQALEPPPPKPEAPPVRVRKPEPSPPPPKKSDNRTRLAMVLLIVILAALAAWWFLNRDAEPVVQGPSEPPAVGAAVQTPDQAPGSTTPAAPAPAAEVELDPDDPALAKNDDELKEMEAEIERKRQELENLKKKDNNDPP